VLLGQWDGTLAPAEWFIPQAMEHLNQCQAYLNDPLTPKSTGDIQNSQGDRAIRTELLKRVAHDPVFQISDDMGQWICPFSQQPIHSINLMRTPWSEYTQVQIVEYLLSAQCPGRYSQWKPEISAGELQRIAGRISVAQTAQSGMKAVEEEMQRLRSRVAELDGKVATAEEIKHDLAAARKVQLRMLPEKPPKIAGYDIASFYEPCEQLGGDLYQFFDVAPGHTGLGIGDVSGHGVAAAVIMAMATKSFGMRAPGQMSPAETLKAVNRDLSKDMLRGKFVSAFYAILDQATGELTCSRAGHPPAYIVHADGRVENLEGVGLALGLTTPQIFESKLEEYTVTLPVGSLLLIYTDGIPEAMDQNHKEFTDEKLVQVLSECANLSAQDTILAVLSAVREHAGSIPMEDDLTLMAVKRL
jgi:serine phosphatase RsbU (regulator of sigma subunit)